MKVITAIELQKRNKHRYNLYINDFFAMGISEDVIIEHSLANGVKITDEFYESVLKTEEESKAFNSALTYISFKARSKMNVVKKLKDKGYDDNIIEGAIIKLEHLGYIDDCAYTKAFINDKQNLQKAGARLIKQELCRNGVSKNLIEEVLEKIIDEDSEYQRALELANKKYKTLNSANRQENYRKISGLLGRKGYSFNIISKVLKEIL